MFTLNPCINIGNFLLAGWVLGTLKAIALSNRLINGIKMENQPVKKEMD